MTEDEKEKQLERFYGEVQWLRDVVPPDDIYEFGQYTIMAAEYFMASLNDTIDIVEEVKKDKVLHTWVNNILYLRRMREENNKDMIKTRILWRDEI